MPPARTEKPHKLPVPLSGLIYALSLGIRLVFLIQAVDNPMMRFPLVDERINWETAQWVLDGHAQPIPYLRPPGHVYALAGLMSLIGRDPFNIRVAQVFLDALSPVLIFLIAVRIFGRAAGLLAGVVASAYWICVFYSCQLLDTSMTCLLCLFLLYLMVRLRDERWWKWLACGVVAGFAALVRPNLLVLAPAIAIAMVGMALLRRRSHPATFDEGADERRVRLSTVWLRCGLLFWGCVGVIAPVTVRNRIVSHDWLLISMTGGANFWMANNPESDARELTFLLEDDPSPLYESNPREPWEWDLSYRLGSRYAKRKLGPNSRYSEWDRLYYRMALDYIRRHPGKFAGDVFKRLCWTFNAYEFANNRDPYEFVRFSPLLHLLSYVHWGVIGPLALTGAAMAFRRGGPGRRIHGPIYVLALAGSMIATGIFFVINDRYRLPMVCVMIPFVGYAGSELVEMVRNVRRTARPPAFWAAFLAALLVFCNANVFGFRPVREPAYLKWFYARACEEVGEKELLPEAMSALGREMAYDADHSPRRHSLSALIRRYQGPFTVLVQYHRRMGNWQEVIRYGQYMLRYEPFDARKVRMYETLHELPGAKRLQIIEETLQGICSVDLGSNEDSLKQLCRTYFSEAMRETLRSARPTVIGEALERLRTVLLERDQGMLGEFYLSVGGGARNQRLLLEAKRLFESLAKKNELEPRHQIMLAETQERLRALQVDPTFNSTAPAGSSPASKVTR